MDLLKVFSLVGLLIYFGILLFAVTKEKKSTNVLEFFFAGRKLPFWAMSITFIASWWGAGSALSTADLAYYDGMGAFWYYGVPVLLSTFIMILFSKSIRRIGYLTQGKMMRERYSQTASIMLAVMVFLFMTITAASQMVGIGDFFGTYLGLDYEIAVIVGTIIVLIYSMFGGFRGVVLTDIIQFILLVISALIVFFVTYYHSGGLVNIAKTAQSLGRTDYMSVISGGKKYFTYVITFGCAWMIQANVWQRISATRNEKDAKKMTVMSFFAYIPLYLIVVFTGMAGIVLYDELPSGGIVSDVVLHYMNPVLSALVFVGISAAIMSTMDSLINTGAMTLVIDLHKNIIRDNPSEKKLVQYSKVATLIVVIIAIFISLKIRSILEISWIASDIISTGAFFPLVLGFVWRRGTAQGAIASMITGLIYCGYNFLHTIGFNVPIFWERQSALQVIIGMGLSLVLYVVVSFLTKPDYQKADKFIKKANIFNH